VPVALELPVPVWLAVCEGDAVPVELEVLVAEVVAVMDEVSELVAVMEGVMVPVPVELDEPVPVWLELPVLVALDELVPVWLLEPVPVELDEPVPVPVALDEPVLVWLAVPVVDGVDVRVMLGGATHTLTASTSSIDDAWSSTMLRTRNCSTCTPGSVMLCCWCSHGDDAKSPSSPIEALNSVAATLCGDTSVMTTTLASSFANSFESMPTQRASYVIVVTAYAVTLNDRVV